MGMEDDFLQNDVDDEKTTHIYLASISTSQIDRANQIILKGL